MKMKTFLSVIHSFFLVFFMRAFGFLCFLRFNRNYIWIVIVVSLSFSSSAHSQPLGHFDPSSLSPIQRGEFLLAQSLNSEALGLYQSLIVEGKGNGYAFRGLIRAYKSMDKLDEAEAWVKNFLADNPGSSPALYGSGYIQYLKSSMGKAEELLNRALEFDKNNALALNNLGVILLNQKSYALALDLVQKAIRVNPKETMFFNNLMTIYKKMGEPGLILTDYNFYLEQEGVSDLVRGYGMAVGRSMRQESFRLYNEGRLDKAILKWVEIEKVYKNINHQRGLVPVYFSLGLLYEENGDSHNAKKYFNLVLMLNPLHIQAKERLNGLQ